jgi:hypothetical protein
MSKKYHRNNLPALLEKYSKSRTLDFHRYSDYHMRLMDGGYITLDVWTTGKYYVLQTDYYKLSENKIIERGGEKGFVPSDDKLQEWLDKLFFAVDL